MADADSAPTREEGLPGDGGANGGLPDWAAEKAQFERQLSELRERDTRQQQLLAGHQKNYQVLKDLGIEKFEDAVPIIKSWQGLSKRGVDPTKFSQAFADDSEPEPTRQQPQFGRDEIAELVREQIAQTNYQARLNDTINGIGEFVKAKVGGDDETGLFHAQMAVENLFFRKYEQGADPAKVLGEAWADYAKQAKRNAAEADGKRMVELADGVTEPKRKTPRSETGGMGSAKEEPQDKVRSQRLAALERKYGKAAMSGSE